MNPDINALWLSFQLASITVIVLLIIAIPLAKWLAYSKNRLVLYVNAIVVLPLVLTPTVIGFYLLSLMRNDAL